MRNTQFLDIVLAAVRVADEICVSFMDEELTADSGSAVYLRCATSTDAHRMEAAFRALRERLAEGEAAAA